MLMNRRSMLAGAAGLPLVPVTLDAARPLAQRIFVFEPQDGVGEIVSVLLERSFGVPVDFERDGAEQARSFLSRNPYAYGAVYWGHAPVNRHAEIWSPARAETLPYPFTLRQLATRVEAVTGWTRKAWR